MLLMRLEEKAASQGGTDNSKERAARARRMAGENGEDVGRVGIDHSKCLRATGAR